MNVTTAVTEQEAIEHAVCNDSILSDVGDRDECDGFTFEVVDVSRGGPRRWTHTVTITVLSNTGLWWQWHYERANTEYQDNGEPCKPYRVQQVIKSVPVTTYERIKG